MLKVYVRQENGDKRLVGELSPDEGVFRKTVQKSKHLYKKLNAWGMSAAVFKQFKDKIQMIEVYDTEEEKLYATFSRKLEKYGQYLHFKPYGAQIFLNLNHWKKYDGKQKQSSARTNENGSRREQQNAEQHLRVGSATR